MIAAFPQATRMQGRMPARALSATLVVIVLGACVAPVTGPGPTASAPPTSAATAITAAPEQPSGVRSPEATPNRTSEPRPTEPPQAAVPPVRIASQPFTIGAATRLIEVVGRYRTDTETALRGWMPYYLEALDKYRSDPEQNRGMFEGMHTPGPYTELLRRSLSPWFGPPGTAPQRRVFELGDLTIQHMYAKPWGRVAYIDATLTYVDRITAADGTITVVPHVQRGRYVNQGRGFYKVIDAYDPLLSRWIDGEQPRWSALALESEAPAAVGGFLQRESYAPGELYPHAIPAAGRFLHTAFDDAWNDSLAKLDGSYTRGDFKTRRFDDVVVRLSRFEPATFLGDGVVTVIVNARLVTAGASESATPVTRTLRFYRISRDGLNASWQVVDEQSASGVWLSGGDLALAEIDQDRG